MTPSPIGTDNSPQAAPAKDTKDLVQEIVQHRKFSFDWLQQNFYDQWRKVHRLYKCEVDPATDENTDGTNSQIVDANNRPVRGQLDRTKTRIGMPDTWSLVQRQVARITAQPPNLKFRADDQSLGDRIGRKLMYDWDRGGIQRGQKRHVAQACLFGISIRAWSWEAIEYQQMRRVDPASVIAGDPAHAAIMDQYGDSMQRYQQEQGMEPGSPESIAMLMGDHSRGNLLPIRETKKKYEGPKANFLFIGDCFFEPNFQSLQSSNWFIVERRRNKAWIKMMGERYKHLAPGFEELLKEFPKGSPDRAFSRDAQNLRVQMMGDIDRIDTTTTNSGDSQMWTITEEWVPGAENKVSYIAEDKIWIGPVDEPYVLNGKIPFTELVLIDDLLSGIGDSHARIIRGLNELHNRHNSLRYDLVDAILRPLIVTTDQNLYENPGLVKRGDGMRLVYSGRGSAALQGVNEGAAIASAAAGMQDEEGILRMVQMATGESNMSQNANVDPQQNRTATGARVQAYNQDILSKAATDMFNQSLNDDATMMYELNRSEMPEAVTFDAARYQRSYALGAPATDPGLPPAIGQPPGPPPQIPQQDMTEVSPLDFQIDGIVEAEVGSTLADDDEAETVKAQNFFALAVGNPETFDKQWAGRNVAVRFGYAKNLEQAMAKPQPAPAPEPAKVALSVSVKFETLPLDVQVALLQKGLIEVPPEQLAKAQAMQAGIQPEVPPTAAMPTMTPPHPGPPQAPHGKPNGHAPAAAGAAQPPTALQAAEGIHGPAQ